MTAERKTRWFDYLEKLIIPAALGILAWRTDVAANKISSSQQDLAAAQFELSTELAKAEQIREGTELDAQLIDLFGKYYFGELPGEQTFAVNVVQNLTSPALREILAEVVANDVRQTDQARSEASSIAEGARQEAENELLFRQLKSFSIGIYYLENNGQAKSIAETIKFQLDAQGLYVSLQARPEGFFGTVPLGNEVRYDPNTETEPAEYLVSIINSNDPSLDIKSRPVATSTPGFLSIMVGEGLVN